MKLIQILGPLAVTVGLVPLAFLAYLQRRGQKRDAAYWWLAGALAVSFLADVASFVVPLRATNDAYPLLQSGLIGLVLLDRPTAVLYCVGLALASLLVPLFGLHRPDWAFATVAWLSVAWIAYRYQALPAWLRLSLLVMFGLGWLAWIGYVLWPGWVGWLAYQGCRAAGTGLFCWAALKPGPRLTLA